MTPITEGVTLQRVRTFFIENFDPTDWRFPAGICSRCRIRFINIEQKKVSPDVLPAPVDFSQFRSPPSADGRSDLFCECDICLVARDRFPRSSKSSAPGSSRPSTSSASASASPALPSPGPITICKRCLRPIGKGIPHPANCGITERRESISQQLSADPRGRELVASAVVREKAGCSGTSSVSLATKSSLPLRVQVPRPSASKALFKDEPIPASEVQRMMVATKLSKAQTQTIAHFFRTWKGRKSFEAGLLDSIGVMDQALAPFFDITVCEMDSSDKEEREKGKVQRPIIYCKDLDGLIRYVKEKRGAHHGTDFHHKIGMDGGGEFLKLTLNIIKVEDELSSPVTKKPPRFQYADGARANVFKESGVKKLIMLAIVQDVSESYENVKTVLNLIGREQIDFTTSIDMKLANTMVGIGSAASTYPCCWCFVHKDDFSDPVLAFAGPLRNLGDIRGYAVKYREAVSKSKSKNKLSSAPFKNCEREPLFNLPDEILILMLVNQMELHYHLGTCNKSYKELDHVLQANGSPMRAKDWSDALGIRPAKQHGGEFIGNHCDKLLNNLDLLRTMLTNANALSFCEPIVSAMEAFRAVKSACFGMVLDPGYELTIKRFGEAWAKTGMSFTPKIHAILVHVPQFLKAKAEEHDQFQEDMGVEPAFRTPFLRGLGHWSEQASESVHSEFQSIWKNYKRDLTHQEYPERLESCVVAFNSRHL